MKTKAALLLIAILFTAQVSADNQRTPEQAKAIADATETLCRMVQDFGAVAMEAHQVGVPMSEMTRSATRIDDELFKMDMVQVVLDAYNEPKATDEKEVGHAISWYSNVVYQKCMSDNHGGR